MSDVLVLGGGLAGAAAATLLARAGRRVVLVEREAAPRDKVCGAFLSREAQLYLGRLGVDLTALGAVPIDRVRLALGRDVAELPLPFRAASLSRRALDEAVLARAAEAGAEILRGRRAAALTPVRRGWEARLEDGATLEAPAVFLATGKHDLRRWSRPPGIQGDLVGFQQHFRLAPGAAAALAGHVELILFAGGYAGLQPVEGGLANLCLVLRERRLAALDRHAVIPALAAESPHLRERLDGAVPIGARPLAVAGIPYGLVCRHADGPWRLGDQAVVMPSFTGDGMSIALHSAALATEGFLAGTGAEAYQRRLARDVIARVWLATGLSQILVRPLPQRAAAALARVVPGIMGILAAATRVPERALLRAGL